MTRGPADGPVETSLAGHTTQRPQTLDGRRQPTVTARLGFIQQLFASVASAGEGSAWGARGDGPRPCRRRGVARQLPQGARHRLERHRVARDHPG
eukprot:1376748-Prymnesium_polylepis.1